MNNAEKPLRITSESTNSKYKMSVEKIVRQVELLKNGNFAGFGSHLTYSEIKGREMYDKLVNANVNCRIEKSKYKYNSVDIIFLDTFKTT